MDRATKEQRVAELQQVLSDVSSVILTEYIGLDVGSMTELRRSLREKNVGYRVVKNTLMRIAIQDTPLEGLSDELVGPIGIAYPMDDDPGAPAKACLDFAKKQEKFGLKAGWADGEVLDPAGIKRLSELPSKDQLRSQLLSLFVTAQRKFLAVMEAAPRDFLGVLNARKADIEGSGDADAAQAG